MTALTAIDRRAVLDAARPSAILATPASIRTGLPRESRSRTPAGR